jgi:hypothetical protein
MSILDRIGLHAELYGTRITLYAAALVGSVAGVLFAATVHGAVWALTTLGG